MTIAVKGEKVMGSEKDLAPIALFCYNRVDNLRQTVAALANNQLAEQSELFIFADGPKNPDDEKVAAVREFLPTIAGFKNITIIASEKNKGLTKSLIAGITEIVNKYGRIIVLEDDIVTGKYFLRYMNDALEMYADDDRVGNIGGYRHPIHKALPNTQEPATFFSPTFTCWGWATWKRVWDKAEFDAAKLLRQIHERNLEYDFNYFGAITYSDTLQSIINGTMDTWDIPFIAYLFLNQKLELMVGKSLVTNIGLFGGEHYANRDKTADLTAHPYFVAADNNPVPLTKVEPVEYAEARTNYAAFHKWAFTQPHPTPEQLMTWVNWQKQYRRISTRAPLQPTATGFRIGGIERNMTIAVKGEKVMGSEKDLAPIALFCYNRVDNLRQTVAALANNQLAERSELFIFADGPKNPDDEKVAAVREFLPTIAGFKNITIIASEKNKGLAKSLIAGITEVVNKYGRIIVVEDDIVTGKYFLRYMNDALEMYADDDRVGNIGGYRHPIHKAPPNTQEPATFFSPTFTCWGWATWKRVWDKAEFDAAKLLRQIHERNLEYDFNYFGVLPYSSNLQSIINGTLDSWAVPFVAYLFLNQKLELMVGKSLVTNIGLFGGEHFPDRDKAADLTAHPYFVAADNNPVPLTKVEPVEYAEARTNYAAFHKWAFTQPHPTPEQLMTWVNWQKQYRRISTRAPLQPTATGYDQIDFSDVANYESEIISQVEPSLREKTIGGFLKSEMTSAERAFVSGIIRKTKPRTVVEIGIAAGGSSVVILNALKDSPTAKLYSFDYNEEWYHGEGKKSGFLVEQEFPQFLPQRELKLGGMPCKHFDVLKNGIDVCLIDTAHFNPGEHLNLLEILPYLNKNAIVIFHDTQYHCLFGCYGSTNCVALNTLKGKRIHLTDASYLVPGQLPNIGAIVLDEITDDLLWALFANLSLPWHYRITEEDYLFLRAHFCRHYSARLAKIYDFYAIQYLTGRIPLFNDDELRKQFEKTPPPNQELSQQTIVDALGWYSRNVGQLLNRSNYETHKKIFSAALRGMGILNHSDDINITGERKFLTNFLAEVASYNNHPSPIIFDIGANEGDYAMTVRKISPTAQIFAFEPHPATFARLQTVAAQHNFQAINLGMSEREQTITLYDRADFNGMGSKHATVYQEVIEDIHHQQNVKQEIKCATIDELVEQNNITAIDLIKIGTEGHEGAVLRGAQKTIAKKIVNAFHIEFNEMNIKSGTSFDSLRKLLPGYLWFRMLPDGLVPLDNEPIYVREIYAYQNLVAVRNA